MAITVVFSRLIGRYRLFDEIAAGGMASVHYGRLSGPAGFARTVAIKRLHPHYAKEAEFVAMLMDEARLASRIRHPNVVSTLDIVTEGDEMLLVMEYVQGVTLSHLLRELAGRPIPAAIATGIMAGCLYGLHAAHECRNETGEPLDVVHRDVSPQNILVGADGVARVVDFGIAKAVGRIQTTQDGQLKGKSAYMAPEQIRGFEVDRRTDVYSASVVLWELLAGERLFTGEAAATVLNAVLERPVPPISSRRPDLSEELDRVIARGLARNPSERFTSAREMAVALERAVPPASSREIGEWVETVASVTLTQHTQKLAQIEASSSGIQAIPSAKLESAPVERAAGIAATDTSQVSDVRPKSRTRDRRAWLLGFGAGAVAVAGAVIAWRVWLVSPSATPDTSSTGAAPSVALSVPLSVAPEPEPISSAVPPASIAAPPASAVLRPKTTVGAAPKPKCDPPYTIDSNGTRHWKKGC